MRVLIVDDDPDFRDFAAHVVETSGFEATTVPDGDTAIRRMYRESFDVVLVDWLMPGVSGVDVCCAIRKRPGYEPYVYVILTTAQQGRDKLVAGLDAGADDFVTKPVDAEVLAARFRAAKRLLDVQRRFRKLQQLITMCSTCRKVRGKRGDWAALELYLASLDIIAFSHGFCPPCYESYERGIEAEEEREDEDLPGGARVQAGRAIRP